MIRRWARLPRYPWGLIQRGLSERRWRGHFRSLRIALVIFGTGAYGLKAIPDTKRDFRSLFRPQELHGHLGKSHTRAFFLMV